MVNTDLFYGTAAEFQRKRRDINDAYEKTMQGLEKAKGSQLYADESKKAADARDASLKALRKEYADRFNASIRCMRDANSKRGTIAPTEEGLRIIQAMQLKEQITERELTAIANSVRDCPLLLSIVQEKAAKNGILRNYTGFYTADVMPAEYAENTINALVRGVNDFMERDTAKAATIARERQERLYGAAKDAQPLPKRPLFNSKQECFKEIIGIDGAEYTAFCAAVDN